MIDKTLIINTLQKHYKCKKDKDFALKLGITNQTLSNWKTRNTFDIDILYTKCENINPVFLLTGEGSIEIENQENEVKIYPKNEIISKVEEPAADNEIIAAQKKTIAILENVVEDLKSDKEFLKNEILHRKGKAS